MYLSFNDTHENEVGLLKGEELFNDANFCHCRGTRTKIKLTIISCLKWNRCKKIKFLLKNSAFERPLAKLVEYAAIVMAI